MRAARPDSPPPPYPPSPRASAGVRWALLVAVGHLAVACTAGPPVLCAAQLADGGCSYHVEVHCGDTAVCSEGSVQVLDAGTCVRNPGADVIGCT
jgi:hypothetical protein